jgi:hypothetical protein
LRRDQLCEPGLCPDAPDDGGRCDHCPLDRLDQAQNTATGLLLQRAIETPPPLKLGVRIGLEDIPADEFYAMVIFEQEQEQFERERMQPGGNR